jgi:hypothetical protein
MEPSDVALVTAALRRGVRVVWDPLPRYRGPSAALALAKQAPDTAREVLRRAAIFRAQAQTPSTMPILMLPGSHVTGCLSCGDTGAQGLRCDLCQLAVQLALEVAPPEAPDA